MKFFLFAKSVLFFCRKKFFNEIYIYFLFKFGRKLSIKFFIEVILLHNSNRIYIYSIYENFFKIYILHNYFISFKITYKNHKNGSVKFYKKKTILELYRKSLFLKYFMLNAFHIKFAFKADNKSIN